MSNVSEVFEKVVTDRGLGELDPNVDIIYRNEISGTIVIHKKQYGNVYLYVANQAGYTVVGHNDEYRRKYENLIVESYGRCPQIKESDTQVVIHVKRKVWTNPEKPEGATLENDLVFEKSQFAPYGQSNCCQYIDWPDESGIDILCVPFPSKVREPVVS